MGPSPWQLLIVLAIVLLLFGTKRIRSLGGDLGSAIKGFKKGISDDDEQNQKKDDSSETEDADNGNVIDSKADVKQDK